MTGLEWNGSRNVFIHTTTWNVLEPSGTVVLTVREWNGMKCFHSHYIREVCWNILNRFEPFWFVTVNKMQVPVDGGSFQSTKTQKHK